MGFERRRQLAREVRRGLLLRVGLLLSPQKREECRRKAADNPRTTHFGMAGQAERHHPLQVIVPVYDGAPQREFATLSVS